MRHSVSLCLILLAALPAAVVARPTTDATFSLHALPQGKTPHSCPAHAGVPCTDYTTNVMVGESYDVYLVVTGRQAASFGIAGASCGLSYDPDVAISSWTRCSDLEFPSQSPAWPASGSGNRITWATSTNCQRDLIPGYTQLGVHAIAGFFRVFSYGEGSFGLGPNNTVPVPELLVADCDARELDVRNPATAVSRIAFSATGEVPGHNPCGDPLPPPPPPPPPSVSASFALHGVPTGDSTPGCVVPVGCPDFNTSAVVGADYDVYLVLVAPSLPQGAGIGGLSCALIYDAAVSVESWTSCGDHQVQSGGWPATQSGNRITWDPDPDRCQRDLVPGYEITGIHAVAGVFRMHAYGAGSFGLTGNPYDAPAGLRVLSCTGSDYTVIDPALAPGRIAFSPQGDEPGYNRCTPSTGPPPPPPPPDGDNSRAVVGFHVSDGTPETACPDGTPPTSPADYKVEWTSGLGGYPCVPGHCNNVWAWLMVAYADSASGIAGLSCGVDWAVVEPSNPYASMNVTWTHCGDIEFRNQNWPAPGGGNRIVWNPQTNCQRRWPWGGRVAALAGVFYISSYNNYLIENAQMRISPNYGADGTLAVVDCASRETSLPPEQGGWMAINNSDAGGSRIVSGCNPFVGGCGPPVPVRHTSWGRIKTLFR